MGTNIKCYATTQVHSPREGREALRQKVQIFQLKNVIRLNRTHSFLNLQAKFFNYKLWQNFQRIKQNSLNSPTYSANYAKFAPIINPFILLYFRGLPRQRTLRNPSKLYRFHAIRPQLPRITRNSHQLLTHLHYVSGTCPGRELSEIPANQAKFTQFTHIVCKLCKIRTIC